jgi:tetratricopeptide (TPR) repeat protein
MATEKSQADTLAAQEGGAQSSLGRKPARLALLLILAIVFFVAVSGLSRVYHAQQEALGNRWFTRGIADLKGQRFERAVSEFRTALLYSRDNYAYQLDLAEALIGLKRTNEAEAYLVNLWDREPENGLVNLELARIAAQKHDTEQSLRYYHNAIYAIWPSDQEAERQNVRLELIEYLFSINDKTQAQSELIALAANLGDDPSQHARAGDLFLRAQDYDHALAEYHLSLKVDRQEPAVLAAAGRAAFELGRYELAHRYLQDAVTADPSDAQSAARLKTTALVLQMDPFRRPISVAERHQLVIQAFAVAGQRLLDCSTHDGAASLRDLSEKWSTMKGQVNEWGLQRNPDLVETSMDLVFSIERQTSATCGAPTGEDLALLLIAKMHEGN